MKDILICLGEYSEKEERFYLTVIKPYNPNVQYTFRSSERFWKINYTTVLNNTGYCVAISQKEVNSKKSPRTKWKCCYFEYINETDDDTIPEKGCMRVRKNNITDLNDLKYFVSKLSSQTVFNCKQN